MAAKKRKKRKKRGRRRGDRASALYYVIVLGLLGGIVFVALGLLGTFAPRASREEPLKVIVQNGCGVEGVGFRTKEFLRRHPGYDVVDFRNADHFNYEETIVIDRTGDLESAAVVARLLGTTNVIQQMPETPLVDITVVVGKDYARFLSE